MTRWPIPFLLLALSACDPCSGVGTCLSPRIRYRGEVFRGVGRDMEPVPAAGVSVRFVPTGGVTLANGSLRTTTDPSGAFMLDAMAEREGEVRGDLWLYPPSPLDSVRVADVVMSTSRAPGDRHFLGRWVVPYPYLGFQFHLFYRATGMPATGAEVTFRRTGGVPVAPDTFRARADARGYVVLRPGTTSMGELVGDAVIHLLPPRQPIELKGLRFPTFVEQRYDSVVEVGIGARLPYAAIIVDAVTGKGVADVEVEFRRKGGVLTSPERFVARSDAFGTVRLDPVPLQSGEVRGDFIVRPPSPWKSDTIADVRLKTVEDERAYEILGYWGVKR